MTIHTIDAFNICLFINKMMFKTLIYLVFQLWTWLVRNWRIRLVLQLLSDDLRIFHSYYHNYLVKPFRCTYGSQGITIIRANIIFLIIVQIPLLHNNNLILNFYRETKQDGSGKPPRLYPILVCLGKRDFVRNSKPHKRNIEKWQQLSYQWLYRFTLLGHLTP